MENNTLELSLVRYEYNPGFTRGRLFVDGGFKYHTLEDVDRGLTSDMNIEELKRIKVKKETAIPTGRYKVEWVFWASHNRYAPTITNVPGYAGIYIHSGNNQNDTEGCPLIGFNIISTGIANSKAARLDFDKIIEEAVKAGKGIYISVERIDGYKLAV